MKRSPLYRKTRMRRSNPERRKRVQTVCFGPQSRLCRFLPCSVPNCSRDSEPAHVLSRGAGGKDDQCVPLCRRHHQEQHAIGIRSFQERHGLNLEVVRGAMQEAVRDHACESWAVLDKAGVASCAVCGSMSDGRI